MARSGLVALALLVAGCGSTEAPEAVGEAAVDTTTTNADASTIAGSPTSTAPVVSTTTAAPSTTAVSTTVPTTPEGWELPDVGDAVPATFVGVTASGSSVRFRTSSGEIESTFDAVPFDTPSELRAWSVPGSSATLLSSCCEPVSGNIYSASAAGEQPQLVYVGRIGRPSPDGSVAVVVQPTQGLAIVGDGRYELLVEDADIAGSEVAWLREVRGIVTMRSRPVDEPPGSTSMIAISVAFGTLDEARASDLAVLDLGVDLARPSLAVAADGTVVVAGCATSACRTTTMVHVDLDSGITSNRTLPYHLVLGGFDPGGRHLIGVDRTNGSPVVFDQDDPTIETRPPVDGLLWVAW
ncbi:MAG: hypothetical protein AAGE98_17630 [Actinomycetota bacterium]